MANTRGDFETFSWNTTLFEVEDTYILTINGAVLDFNEYNLRTGQITNIPIGEATTGSASDDANKIIYFLIGDDELRAYDINTKAFISSIIYAPALPAAGSSAAAFNPQDGLIYAFTPLNGVPPLVWTFTPINPITGVRGTPATKPAIPTTGHNGTGLAISSDGRFYWGRTTDIGGGQWQMDIWSWTLANPTETIIASQVFPNPRLSNTGSTYQIDNKIYFGSAADGILWSYDIDTNTFDLFVDNIPPANSLGAYTLGPVPGVCFRRNYKQDMEGNVTFTDTDFNGNPYTLVGGADCDPVGVERTIITQDTILNPGDSITIPANTNRSINIKPISGTVDINGATIPTTSVFEVSQPESVINRLGTPYTIDNITGTTYMVTTRYV